jgi:uncharacterized protein YbcI
LFHADRQAGRIYQPGETGAGVNDTAPDEVYKVAEKVEVFRMNEPNKPSPQEVALAAALLKLWESAHGMLAGNVRVLMGPDSVAAWIEAVLSPAEQAVARRNDGHLLIQRYAEELLNSIQPELQAQVETITGRRVVSSNARPDVETGHVLCFFVLGEQLSETFDSRTEG